MKKDLALNNIADLMLSRTETLSIAESVTAGLLMANISLSRDATSFFQGGITAYNLGQKSRQLSVDPIVAEKTNCVSEVISQQMAKAIASEFCSHWGIGITGYAVPVPEININSCFAYVAISYDGSIVFSGRIESDRKGQYECQQHFVANVLEILLSVIQKLPNK